MCFLAKGPGYTAVTGDVTCAFFHADEEEEVYVDPPTEWKDIHGHEWTWKLAKQLYGRRPAPRKFSDKVASVMCQELQMLRCKEVPHLYFHPIKKVAIEVHVDDFYAVGPGNAPWEVMSELKKFLTLSLEGPFTIGDSFVHLNEEASDHWRWCVDYTQWLTPQEAFGIDRFELEVHRTWDSTNQRPRCEWRDRIVTWRLDTLSVNHWHLDVLGQRQARHPIHCEWTSGNDVKAHEEDTWSSQTSHEVSSQNPWVWALLHQELEWLWWPGGMVRLWLGRWQENKKVENCSTLDVGRMFTLLLHKAPNCSCSIFCWSRTVCHSKWCVRRDLTAQGPGVCWTHCWATSYHRQLSQQCCESSSGGRKDPSPRDQSSLVARLGLRWTFGHELGSRVSKTKQTLERRFSRRGELKSSVEWLDLDQSTRRRSGRLLSTAPAGVTSQLERSLL